MKFRVFKLTVFPSFLIILAVHILSMNFSLAEDQSGEQKPDQERLAGGLNARAIEQALDAELVTILKTPRSGTKIIDDQVKTIHILMPTDRLNSAFKGALRQKFPRLILPIKSSNLNLLTFEKIEEIIQHNDLIITGYMTPEKNLTEQQKTENWLGGKFGKRKAVQNPLKLLHHIHRAAKTLDKKVVFISNDSTADILTLTKDVDAAFILPKIKMVKEAGKEFFQSTTIDFLIKILAGDEPILGVLPQEAAGLKRPVVGAAQLEIYKKYLTEKRAGLIVNQSSKVGEDHLIDILRKEGLNIAKLFAVEHGVRGTEDAGAILDNDIDQVSDLAIISIYGKKKAPSPEDLTDVDVMVFDLQDVGVRFYTYLSSLHHIMDSCAQNKVPLLVLDRPNPNGSYVDGPVLEPAFQSFVGMHPIPLLHGMTLGELARMINGEGWLSGGRKCNLTVIPVQNYGRSTPYVLPVRPSPNLPNQRAIELYPSLGLFEAAQVSVGRGTDFPFQALGGGRPEFGSFTFTPTPKKGAATSPKLQGIKLYGKDYRAEDVRGLNIEIFKHWYDLAQEIHTPFLTRPDWLDKLMGTDRFRQQIEAGMSVENIRKSWEKGLVDFKIRRAPYLLYPDS